MSDINTEVEVVSWTKFCVVMSLVVMVGAKYTPYIAHLFSYAYDVFMFVGFFFFWHLLPVFKTFYS
jgi:hypothetical protein